MARLRDGALTRVARVRLQDGPLARAARLDRCQRRQLTGAVALALGALLAAAALLSTSGYLISRAAQRPDILALTAVITAVRGLALVRATLRYGERLVSHDLALGLLARLRARFYSLLAPLGPTVLGGRRRGELLSRFVADVDVLQDLYLRALVPPAVALMLIIAVSLGAYMMLAAAGAWLCVGLLATAIVVPVLSAAVAARAGRRQAPARGALTTEIVECLDGARELAVYGQASDRLSRLDQLGAELRGIAAQDAIAAALGSTLNGLLSGLTILLLLLIAIPAVHAGSLDPMLLAALVLLALGAFEGLTPLPAAARALRSCVTSARRLDELASLTPAVSDPARPQPLDRDAAPGALALARVSFRHGPREPWLARDISVSFAPGCRCAITGPSGTGKSTLALLLVRFLDPTGGTVSLGGHDLRDLSLDSVRSRVVHVAQDAHIFNTSVRANLALANPEASEDELQGALAAVGLDRWIAGLPDGLDTAVGDQGNRLSGGEHQRLAVARALLADVDFIVLDEPTGQLDAATAAELIAAMDRAAGDRGLIVITHRAEGMEHFAQVLTLGDGQLTVRERDRTTALAMSAAAATLSSAPTGLPTRTGG